MGSRVLYLIVAIVIVLPSASFAQPQIQDATETYGRLPLMFEKNQGQADPEVEFVSHGEGYTAFLTHEGLTLSWGAAKDEATDRSRDFSVDRSPEELEEETLQLRLLGAANSPSIRGEDRQPGGVNYFVGNDPMMWHTHVPTYGQVRYKDVYPGIDLVYHGSHRQLEYDFEIKPGSDPRRIRFELQGARQIKLDSQGNLLLKAQGGDFCLQRPVVYQQSRGRRVVVDGFYAIEDSTHVAFNVPVYDSSSLLVIDPVLVYATYLGGTGSDQASGIAVDSDGSVYLTGSTTSIDFPHATLGSLAPGVSHVFVAKLNPSGTNLVYADYIGGNNADSGVGLVLDSANEIYVTGSTQSSNFPVVNAYQSQQPGPNTGFLTRVSSDGSSLLYSTYLGGSKFDQPSSIAIDGLGEVYLAGYTQSQNFPVVNAYQASVLANQNGAYGTYGFLTKFNAQGSALVYSTYFAGNLDGTADDDKMTGYRPRSNSSGSRPPYSAISALALDASGNAYVTGTTNTVNFPVTAGAYLTSDTAPPFTSVGFVSKFSYFGSLDYSTYFYGSSGQPVSVAGIAVDSTGSAFITGSATSDGTFPVTTTSICDPEVDGPACDYAFVTKFNPTGATLLYSTFLGPYNYATPQAIVLDPSDDAYIVSSTSGASFQTNDAIETYTNQQDLLLVEIDPAATTQLFATYLGGNGNDTPGGLAVDTSGNIYVAGFTDSTDFPITDGAFQGQLSGTSNLFVAKIGAGSTSTVSMSPGILQFSSEPLGLPSQPQQVQVRNMSSQALNITSISASGDFAETGNCGNSLPPAGSCALSVTFTPTVAGTRTGSALINDTGVGTPQSVSLQGIGQGPFATLVPASLVFPSTQLGLSSAPQTVTLSSQGTTTLNISGVQITGDYSQTNNCPGALAVGSSCTFNVIFTPTAAGTRAGALAISDNVSGSPQNVTLSGSGSNFSLATSSSAATVKAGSAATYTVIVAPTGGSFNNVINLACSGAPKLTTCSMSRSSVTPGSNSSSVTVTIITTAATAEARLLFPIRRWPLYAVCSQLQAFGLFGVVLAGSTRWRKKARRLAVFGVIGMLLFLSACAGGTGIAPVGTGTTPTTQPGTAPGSYTITVTGTSGNLQHSLPLSLTVQ